MAKYKVDSNKCIGCGTCMSCCPRGAIDFGPDGKAVIDKEKCQGCGTCATACPVTAISEDK